MSVFAWGENRPLKPGGSRTKKRATEAALSVCSDFAAAYCATVPPAPKVR